MQQPTDFAKLSLMDALDLAILVEEEARERYEEFSRVVGGRYKGDAADMFRLMASYEQKHGAELAARRAELFGDAPRNLTRDSLYEIEAPDRNKPRVFMSARQAMEVALDSEEKAAMFFAEAVKHVTNADVKTLFTELHKEEVQHQALVRERLSALPPGSDLDEDEADEPGSDPGN
jgi:rubrerythrin